MVVLWHIPLTMFQKAGVRRRSESLVFSIPLSSPVTTSIIRIFSFGFFVMYFHCFHWSFPFMQSRAFPIMHPRHPARQSAPIISLTHASVDYLFQSVSTFDGILDFLDPTATGKLFYSMSQSKLSSALTPPLQKKI